MKKLIPSMFMSGVAAALVAVPVFAEDQGTAIAVAAQEGPSAVSLDPAQPFVSATEKVQETLSKLGLFEGYNAEKQSIIVVGASYLATKNPAGDKDFMIKRSAKAMEAYLNAKAEIIRAFSMNFSAADQIATAAEFGDSPEKLEVAGKIEEAKAKLAAFADKAGKPELADAAFDDNLVATLKGLELAAPAPTADAMIAAADAATDAQSTAGAVIAAAATVGASLADAPAGGSGLAAERDALVADVQAALDAAKAIPMEPVNETTSTVSLMSKMPLLGASVLTQAESWDKNQGVFEIAMAVIWSPKRQEEAKNLAVGTPKPGEKMGKFTAQEWLAKQDLLAMVGPRRFIDNKGNTIVIGLAARDLTGIPVVKQKPAMQLADTDAMRYVATALMCDLEAFRETSQNLKEYEDDTSSASEKISDKIASKTSLQLSGVVRLGTKQGNHPITGHKIYATAYYLDPVLSKDAMEKIKQLYADAIIVENATQYMRGQLAGMEQTLQQAQQSTQQFDAGVQVGTEEVVGLVQQQTPTVQGPQGSTQTVGPQQGGVATGDNLGTIDVD